LNEGQSIAPILISEKEAFALRYPDEYVESGRTLLFRLPKM